MPNINTAAGQRPAIHRLPSSKSSISSTPSTNYSSTATPASVAQNRTPQSRRPSEQSTRSASTVSSRRSSMSSDSLSAFYGSVMDATAPLQKALISQAPTALPSHYSFVNKKIAAMLRSRLEPPALLYPITEEYPRPQTDYNLLKPTMEVTEIGFPGSHFDKHWHNFGQLRIDKSTHPPKIILRFSSKGESLEITSSMNKYGGPNNGFSGFRAIANVCGAAMQGEGILVVFDWICNKWNNNQLECVKLSMVGFYSKDLRILSHPRTVLPEVEKNGRKKKKKAPWHVPIGRSETKLPFQNDELMVFRLGGGYDDRMMDAYGIRRIVAY